MVEYFKTVNTYGSDELVIKRSRFIGHACPVYSEEEALAFIGDIKKRHSLATHNCSAYRIGERDECQKHSDDGEPAGTAGKPIMEVVRQQGLKNVAVVVTRYFGGIMLGAGGLVRAYTDGAVAGIAAAGPVYQVLHTEIAAELDYTWLGKVENGLRARGTITGETVFTDRVRILCLPQAGQTPEFIAWLNDLTQGQALIREGVSRYIPHPFLPLR